ncbi:uncharacterized protein NESG_02104 [Nematocida ausubeli]|uniref:Uncharacterized protein n=1 Tax=Nematocida ausubeli (strain ATCC PRA-371 / ERTm2) TaxID=1913371 RepID=A0A086IZL4_NEMA1|nr:uncharacterized protein NESG_02104 [Nematocida ausubeli]KFG25332.1 hypothetical protein NESG_02104 [Nematocida ausubeli]
MENFGPVSMALIIFGVSFAPSLLPSVLLASKRLKNIYDKASIVSAGLLLAILFVDFMPHLVNGGCSHTHEVNHEAPGIGAVIGHTHSHSHGHGCSHSHGNGWEEKVRAFNPGLVIAGLTLISLIIIDQRVIKHAHCNKERTPEKAESGEILHSHSHVDVHAGHSHGTVRHEGHPHVEHLHASELNNILAERQVEETEKSAHEIKGCCTDGLKYKTTVKQALIFIFIFSIHSIFEGFAFTPGQKGTSTLFIGLAVHKVLESITVGIALFSSQFSKKVAVGLLFVYSSLTPIGMVSAYLISHVINSWIIRDIFNGISFGSLSFIVLVEMLPPIVHSLTTGMKIFYLLCGYAVGAVFISMAHAH